MRMCVRAAPLERNFVCSHLYTPGHNMTIKSCRECRNDDAQWDIWLTCYFINLCFSGFRLKYAVLWPTFNTAETGNDNDDEAWVYVQTHGCIIIIMLSHVNFARMRRRRVHCRWTDAVTVRIRLQVEVFVM